MWPQQQQTRSAKTGCGHPGFQVQFHKSNTPYLIINKESYRVLSYNNQSKMKIASGTVFSDCGLPKASVDLTVSPFNLASSSAQNITLLTGCQALNEPLILVPCNDKDIWVIPFGLTFSFKFCNTSIEIPVLE